MPILEGAAASVYGPLTLLHLFISRTLNKFGFTLKPKIEMVGFKLLLLPTWKVDLAMEGRVLIRTPDGESYELDTFSGSFTFV